jgi:hypothetical protein
VYARVLHSAPMKCLLRLLPVVLLASARAGATAEPGLTDLFDGKDFTGWKIALQGHDHDSSAYNKNIRIKPLD